MEEHKDYTKIETEDCLSLPPLIFNFPWAPLEPQARHLNYNNCFRTSRSPVKAKTTPEIHFKKPRLSRKRGRMPAVQAWKAKSALITSQPEEMGTYRQRDSFRSHQGVIKWQTAAWMWYKLYKRCRNAD